ncbi:hypothetical protein SteCoe_7383 [Stentor coeruleus]|uniref:Protein kinase domain-containing protein n=1 Tax=Stentor coeruleus TaxID=5963 RepID=A0A1R2CMN0_9CILI|nr:hypothetical protein SteCoe_7383 [Stentor coeruleus]
MKTNELINKCDYELIESYNHLGNLYKQNNKIVKANECYKKSEEIRKNIFVFRTEKLQFSGYINKENNDVKKNIDQNELKDLKARYNTNKQTLNIKKKNYIRCLPAEISSKVIVPLFQCSKVFSSIYGKCNKFKQSINKNTTYEVLNIFENKKYNINTINWKLIYFIYNEIKLIKILTKESDSFPQIYYYCIFKYQYSHKIRLGMENCSQTIFEYIQQNKYLRDREMKILFYGIIKSFFILRQKYIVHNDISPDNILVESPEKVKLCDFGESFLCKEITNSNNFVMIWPTVKVSKSYLSPEKKVWARLMNTNHYIKYNPFKSDVFSIGLCLLKVCGIDINGLNDFGMFYDVHIFEILTIGYDYIVKDTLRKKSYDLLRNELQAKIDKKIEEFPYEFLKDTLRKMLEVDMVKRSDIQEIFKDASYFMGKFD